MVSRLLAAFATASMFWPASAWSADPEAAKDVAQRFCAARLAYDETATRALLSRGLLAAIERAEERNDVLAKGNPHEKPPLGDGIPYAAYPDAPDTCKAQDPATVDGVNVIGVRYGFKVGDSGWTDRLVLVDADGRVAIDDVLFPQFTTDSEQYGLRRALLATFDQWDDEMDAD